MLPKGLVILISSLFIVIWFLIPQMNMGLDTRETGLMIDRLSSFRCDVGFFEHFYFFFN